MSKRTRAGTEILEREHKELLRTRRALSREVDELVRQKAALSSEIDAMLLDRSSTDIDSAVDSMSEFHQRFFTRLLEREIHRCARENGARFSAVEMQTEGPPPPWFDDFLNKTVRLSDVAVRISTSRWRLFLPGAGGLGRRLFLSRFARNLLIAVEHHGEPKPILVGAATFPVDGQSVDDLVEVMGRRAAPLRIDEGLKALDFDPPRARRSSPISLLPPEGAMEATQAGAEPDRILDAIQRASQATEGGGELVVRSEDTVGRIYIYEGKVAWAHCTSRDVSLAEYLVAVGGADPDEVRFAYEHCRQTGANFAETLIDFGTFERSEMRHVLCQHLRAHLDAILQLPAPELLFLPQSRVYQSELLFPLSALLAHRPTKRASIVDALKTRANAKRPA